MIPGERRASAGSRKARSGAINRPAPGVRCFLCLAAAYTACLAAPCAPAAQAAAQEPRATGAVSGRVADARGGEALARVRVRLLGGAVETLTDAAGRFRIEGLSPGSYILHVETVGYRLVKEEFTLEAGGSRDFDVALSPDTFRRTDTVEVTAGVFDLTAQATPAELTLTGPEVKNLGSVLLDDPIRAVHALPGVSANNDFQSRFALRGAGFERMGLYLDDVLLHAPFHAIADEGDGSLSMINGEIVSEMLLLPIAPPVRYGDRTAGVLDVRTREGSRTRRSIRAAAGVAGASVLVETPFAEGRGSWLASARKSYLQYLVSRISTDSALGIGFTDYQSKLAWSLTSGQTATLYVLDGDTALDRTSARSRSGVNALIEGGSHVTIARAGWQYAASNALVVNAAGAFSRERFETFNRDVRPLDFGFYGEWSGTARATWYWRPRQALEAGWSARRLRGDGSSYSYFIDPRLIRVIDSHRGKAVRQGGYLEQSWQLFGGRLRGAAGARFDAHGLSPLVAASPQASLAVRTPGDAELQLAWGQYVQFPELAVLTSPSGGPRLAPERANHFAAAIEKRIAGNARVRFEIWNRDDRDLLARPMFDPRLVGARVVVPNDPRFQNSVRGYSRGGQVMVQRRSANRLSGWLSYTLSWARVRDRIENSHYWARHDQRHLVNAYLSYRLTSSLNLSGRWGYGSGEPIPGYITRRDGVYYVAARRNELRLPAYQRADVRANKSFTYDRWKFTLYGEVINITNRRNIRFVSFDGANTRTGRASLTIDRVFPIVPVAGITLEF